MIVSFVFLLIVCGVIHGIHFNGGTITWAPVNPYDNSSFVPITITQSYSWSYPTMTCTTNVPITTPGRSGSNTNLTCVVNCATDGGYATHPINILTDCTSFSSTLGMMTSQRSSNITLLANASFSISYEGSAWRALGYPAVSGLYWSILCAINLIKRPDGFINTPPVAAIVSPQYVIVNKTTQIKIPVSDANAGDDVRCRWSVYTPGYRRKRQSNQYADTHHRHVPYNFYKNQIGNEEKYIRSRVKRLASGSTTVVTAPTATPTTTSEIAGTIPTTSSYIHRNAIDECGGICYPSSTPNGTTLSGCTITFTGTQVGAWYAVSLQIEDFINTTSNQSMSSVPVQFLIYVLPTPYCALLPVFIPITGCLEVQVNVPFTFDLYANNSCNPTIANITDIIVSTPITGMTDTNLTSSPDGSFAFVTFTWTPQPNQIGPQQFCTVAFTSELLQSNQYCVTFTVQTGPPCQTTTSTTSTSSTTSKTTSTTSTSSTTTSTTSTSSTTTSTTSTSSTTTSTTSTSSTTTSTTSTSSTTTSTTSTSSTTTSTTTTTSTSSTTSTTSSTATTSTSTSTSTSTTSATSTSSTTTTSTSSTASTTSSTATTSTSTTTTTTSLTTATTVTSTTATTTTATTTENTAGANVDWLLISGISLLALLMAICCCCCCLYYFLWGPDARRRIRKYTFKEQKIQHSLPYDPLNSVDETHASANTTVSNNQHVNVTRVNNSNKPVKIGNPMIKAPNEEKYRGENQVDRHFSVGVSRVKKKINIKQNNENSKRLRSTEIKDGSISIIKVPRIQSTIGQRTNKIHIEINDLTKNDGFNNNSNDNQYLKQKIGRSDIDSVNVTKVNARTSRSTD